VIRKLPAEVRAFAKINVTLRVLGVRADGYHELRTVFQSIQLHDRLVFEPASGPFAIVCDDPACPTDERNLVWRAAALLWRASGRRGAPRDVRVHLFKGIPAQAGLGGGSSDAAATLRTLSAVWCPGAFEERELAQLGRTLGADVPYFLHGGTVLGVERGDRLFPLVDAEPAWVVLAQPDFGVSTADAYRWFDARSGPAVRPSGRAVIASPGPVPPGPYGDGGNDLEGPVARRHPAIGRLVRSLGRQGAVWAAMSGSGSVCFGLFRSAAAARRAAASVRSPRVSVWVTRTLSSAEYRAGSEPMSTARARR